MKQSGEGEVMQTNRDKYIPALSYEWLTGFYDPVVRWTTREITFKRRLLEQAKVQPTHEVLDLGCGTATLTVAIKRAVPQATVRGLDGDAKILAIARNKARKAGVEIFLDMGLSYELPYTDAAFDRVVSSLFFHHLTKENKLRTLNEVWRVLQPGGELHIADWGEPHNSLMRVASLPVRWLDGATTADSFKGLLPRYLQETGFVDASAREHYATLFGTLRLYQAIKPK